MAEGDTRRWSLRNPGAEISNNNVPTTMLVLWAMRGIIKPGYTISADGETWLPAEALPELEMEWYVVAPGRAPYGPITKSAAELFVQAGHFPEDALITQDPGEQPVSMELPLPIEPPKVDEHLQELEELKKKVALLEKELRLKDRRIDELRQEVVASQSELNVEGVPDFQTLEAELATERSELARAKAGAQEAAEAAAERERALRQRIHTLESALEVAQANQQSSEAQPNDALYEVLAREAELLRQSQDEEERFMTQLRELAHARLVQLSERLLEIRRLAGDNPEQMIHNAMRRASLTTPTYTSTATAQRRDADQRTAELERALQEARERETALQRQLVAQEGRETQLRAQIGLAERRSRESLDLDEKLQDTAKALAREQAAREEEHRENAHIQEQLLRRIEELERLTAQGTGAPVYYPAEPIEEPPRTRSSFGWLKKH